MRIGIDWVSAAIFLAAFAFSQVRTVPARARYGVLAAACGGIGFYRLNQGATGPNQYFVYAALGLAVFYTYRAIRANPRGGA